MSLDNVLGVAGAAGEHYGLLYWLSFINCFDGICSNTYFKLDKKVQMIAWQDY